MRRAVIGAAAAALAAAAVLLATTPAGASHSCAPDFPCYPHLCEVHPKFTC